MPTVSWLLRNVSLKSLTPYFGGWKFFRTDPHLRTLARLKKVMPYYGLRKYSWEPDPHQRTPHGPPPTDPPRTLSRLKKVMPYYGLRKNSWAPDAPPVAHTTLAALFLA